jgi:hypothetical protein
MLWMYSTECIDCLCYLLCTKSKLKYDFSLVLNYFFICGNEMKKILHRQGGLEVSGV